MEDLEKDGVRLPDNAFRELKEGEQYRPVMAAGRRDVRHIMKGASEGMRELAAELLGDE